MLPDLIERLGPETQDRIMLVLTGLNITGWIRSLAGKASGVLQGSIMVILFVGFMFAERGWFAIKIERLTEDHEKAAEVRRMIATIMHRVNRYLVVKTAVSAATAFLVWIIFRAAGLELAVSVAILTFVLNFIPATGSIIATAIATILAFVLTGDTGLTIVICLTITGVQFAIGNVLDPMLLGQTLRLSSFGIILSLAFWGLVWGIPGTFLAVPIMVALMIVCAQIPWLRPVAIILSREGLPDDGTDGPFAATGSSYTSA